MCGIMHGISDLGFSSIRLPSPTIISSLSYLRLRGLGMSKIKLDHKGDGAGFWNRKEKEGVSFEGRRSNEHVAGPYVGPWAPNGRTFTLLSVLLQWHTGSTPLRSLFRFYSYSSS
ncbi:hypothetical protein C347_03974 [Cryptococcus neoformans AD2-60a]|nr:hypothetical protein C347_03974 [Cryptococcus neoformans var. grubii AD2-60a]